MNVSYFEHSRTPSLDELEANDVHESWRQYCESGNPAYDLSVSNPTVVGLPSVSIDLNELSEAVHAKYQASPQGLIDARRSISQFYKDENDTNVDPENIQLFASTSEAFGALIKLFCEPLDNVVTCIPTYPLLDCLTSLESVRLKEVPLQDCAGEWCIDFWTLANTCDDRTRALIVVSPNNPTGHCIQNEELHKLCEFCAQRKIVLIIDEVFASYRFNERQDLVVQPAAARCDRGLVVSLSGLSKVCGLPQHKLGWAVFGGEKIWVSEAMARLQFITDSTLSVSGWVQAMLPHFLLRRREFVMPCMHRMRNNFDVLYKIASMPNVRWTVDEPDGGWSACIRLPGWADDESAAVFLAKNGVRIFPGAFFGYRENQPSLVVSLLPQEDIFREGIERLASLLDELL